MRPTTVSRHRRDPLIRAAASTACGTPRHVPDTADGHGELFVADPHDRTTRHDYETLYQRNGAIYIVSSALFSPGGTPAKAFTPMIYEMPWERSINIDGPEDLSDRQGADRKRPLASGT